MNKTKVFILKGMSYDEGNCGFFDYDWIIGVYTSYEKAKIAKTIAKRKYRKTNRYPVNYKIEEKELDSFLV